MWTDLQLLDLPLEAHGLVVKSIGTDIGHSAESSLHLAHDDLSAPQAQVSKLKMQHPTPDPDLIRVWRGFGLQSCLPWDSESNPIQMACLYTGRCNLLPICLLLATGQLTW